MGTNEGYSDSVYKEKLKEWRDHFGWKIPNSRINGLEFPSRAGCKGITLFFGEDRRKKGLVKNLRIVMKVLRYELKLVGMKLELCGDLGNYSYFPGSEPKFDKDTCNGVTLRPANLGCCVAITGGLCIDDFRTGGQSWPGLEVFWLVALNISRIFAEIDRGEIPAVLVPGFNTRSGWSPIICFFPGVVSIGNAKQDFRRCDAVAFACNG